MFFKHVRLAMQENPEYIPLWEELLGDFIEFISEPSRAESDLAPEIESFLEEVIAFKGELKLDEKSSFPHSRSPEQMAKSLAVQTIRKSKPDAFPEFIH